MTTTDSSPITTWFQERNVTVLNLKAADERALLLGEIAAAAAISDACAKLTGTLGFRMTKKIDKTIYISRKDLTDHEVGELRKFATQLAEVGIIDRMFRPDRSAVGVVPLTRTQTNGVFFDEMAGFMNGTWYEYFALGVAHRTWGDSAALAHQVLLELPGEQKVEIDLFALVNGEPVWVECKTGKRFEKQLAKYGTFARTLGINKERSILAVRDVPEDKATRVGHIHQITVTVPSGLAAALDAATKTEGAGTVEAAQANLRKAAVKAGKQATTVPQQPAATVTATTEKSQSDTPAARPEGGFLRRLFGR